MQIQIKFAGPVEKQYFLEFSTFAALTHTQIHWAASLLSELNKYHELSSQTTLKENSVNACCAKMSSTPFSDYTHTKDIMNDSTCYTSILCTSK